MSPYEDEEQPPHPADCVDDAPPVKAPKKRERKAKAAPVMPASVPPIYLLYSGKIAFQTDRGWVEAHAKVAKSIMISAGVIEPVARDLSSALPPAAGLTFDPRSTEPVIVEGGETWLNTFKGMPPHGPAGGHMMVELLLGHLVNGDKKGYEYLLDWIAAPLQSLYAGRGSKRNLSAIVFVGNEGTGKGIWTLILEQIYGAAHVVKMDQSALEDLFTPVGLESALMVVANEVTSKTNRGDEHIMNKMKEWITEDRIPMRRMHVASQAVPVHFNMMFTTNNTRHPVKISAGDRRYTVFDQPDKLPKEILNAFIEDRAAGWPQVRAFAEALRTREITHELIKPYENDARSVVQDASKDPATAFAEWLVEVGIEVVSEEWVLRQKANLRLAGEDDLEKLSRPWADVKNGRFVPARIMAQIFGTYCAAFNPKARSVDGLPAALAKVGIIGDQRQKYNGKSSVGYMPVPASDVDAVPAPKSTGYTSTWERVKN